MPDDVRDGDKDISHTLTRLLQEAGSGHVDANERLMPLIYDELRAMALARMKTERVDHTLQATALVHEAFIRLTGGQDISWDNRAHFFGAAARAMQRVLVEHARARSRQKRSGTRNRLPLSVVDLAVEADLESVLAVQEAVERLALQDDRMAEVVRLRFYAGLDVNDTAQILGVSERTVRREWSLARAWLRRELDDGD